MDFTFLKHKEPIKIPNNRACMIDMIKDLNYENKILTQRVEDLEGLYHEISNENYRLRQENYLLKDTNETIKRKYVELDKSNNELHQENTKLHAKVDRVCAENEELRKVLNIYQAITDIYYSFMADTAMVRLNGEDGAGRAFIHDGDSARALYNAYVKYHDTSFKYKPGEKPDYKMTKKEQDEWIARDMFASACYAMESLAKSADALATHLQKRQVYLANPKSLKVPVEFMLEDARYNFPFLREKRVWALDTCITNVIRIEVMYGKPYYYDFNRQSLTAIDVLMED